jgi:hypothetical protein
MMTKKEMANNFSMQIESAVKDHGMTYMDAIVFMADKKELEMESAAKLLNKNIKNKLEAEARMLNFLPKRSRLPI